MKLVTSSFTDIDNIFHVFAREICAIARLTGGDPECTIVLKSFKPTGVNYWRRDFLQCLYRGGVHVGSAPALPRWWHRYESRLKVSRSADWVVDPWAFRDYERSDLLCSLAGRVREHYCPGGPSSESRNVVLVERSKDRMLHDHATGEPLSAVLRRALAAANVPFACVCFDSCSLREQVEALRNARIMIAAHGAAITNLMFLPPGGSLFEVNFRRHWYCDPVCHGHRTGAIGYTVNCGGPLTYRSYFHKADYHNLSQVFGVRYREFEIEDARTFLSNNPISVQTIYVDAGKIIEAVLA